ncbi:MAG: hypothetical protein M3547_01340 [Acidobacteriota bacterium]|nr:hypothetical protein [Acidobacteriota bacterium]
MPATATPTATVPPPTATQTPTSLGPSPAVPTLSFPMLALLGLMLAGTGIWLMVRRN